MQILKWILYTSIYAGLCAVFLCMATEKLLLSYMPPFFSVLHGFIFGNTLVIYNVHYGIKNIPAGISDRADWSRRYRYIHPLIIGASLLLSGVCLLFLSYKVMLVSVGLGVLALGYSLPILPFKNKKRLKDWGVLKIFLLCFVWACVTVIIPLVYYQRRFESYEVEFILRFILMLPLCVAFDIRDMQIDKENRIYTLPNVIGVKNAYRLIDLSLLAFALLSVWQYVRYPIMHRLVCGILIAVITKSVIELSRRYNSDFYYLLFIDGVMLVYALMILL